MRVEKGFGDRVWKEEWCGWGLVGKNKVVLEE